MKEMVSHKTADDAHVFERGRSVQNLAQFRGKRFNHGGNYLGIVTPFECAFTMLYLPEPMLR